MISIDDKRLAEIEANVIKADMGGNLSDMSIAIDDAHDLIAEIRAMHKLIEQQETVIECFQAYGCPICRGDCASANPPVT